MNRVFLFIVLAVALVAWIALLLFTYFVPPQTFLALVVTLLLIGIALASSSTLVAYAIGRWLLSKRGYYVTVRYALRQGTLVALVVVLNIVLRLFQSWNIVTALVLVGAAVIVEVLFLARKW